MMATARSFTWKIWAGSEVFTVAVVQKNNHITPISPDELKEERRRLNAHVVRVGIESSSVGGALDFAAQWICSYTRSKTKVRTSLRYLAAHLLAWRLLRKSDLPAVCKRVESHLKSYNRIRMGLVKKGISDKSIGDLSSGIAGLTQGLERRE